MYAIQKAEKSADIYIYGDITKDVWWEGDVSANSLVAEIKALGDVERIDVHIDSYGGAVSEGWAIYNALRETNAKIRTYADGFVASAAAFPFLAGDERVASSVSAFFLHNVLTYAEGNAKDLRKVADELEKMTEIGINAFVDRAGMNRDTVQTLMDNETWLSADEALGYGIATSVNKDTSSKYAQSAKSVIIQKVLEKANKAKETLETAKTEETAETVETVKTVETVVDEKPKSIFEKFRKEK